LRESAADVTTILLLAALVLDQLIETSVSIAPGRFEEPCIPLEAGDRLDYEFRASAPLDFNLHYHETEVFFPVDVRDVATREGSYVAPAAQTYCLMWTNHQSHPVDLDYRYRSYTREADR
jgi:hypothetical protein